MWWRNAKRKTIQIHNENEFSPVFFILLTQDRKLENKKKRYGNQEGTNEKIIKVGNQMKKQPEGEKMKIFRTNMFKT